MATGLPTSEEWEYAARGGAVSKRFPWGGDTISHSQANYYAVNSSDYDLSSGGYHPSYNSGGYSVHQPGGFVCGECLRAVRHGGERVGVVHGLAPVLRGLVPRDTRRRLVRLRLLLPGWLRFDLARTPAATT